MHPTAHRAHCGARERGRAGFGQLAGVVLVAVALAGCGTGSSGQRSTPSTVGKGEVLVATLGDSILAGTPLWDPDPETRSRIREPDERSQWQYWAAREHPGVRFRNCGVNRERTDQIAARLDRCARGADVLVIQGGINDLAQGRDPEEAVRSLRSMVRAGRASGAHVLLADVLPWNAGFPDYAERIRTLNAAIHDMAKEEDVAILPFHDTLEDPRAPGRMREEWTIDGSHPSIRGHRRLGERAFRLPEGVGGDGVAASEPG